jgi:hypothetical protein
MNIMAYLKTLYNTFVELCGDENYKMRWVVEDWCILMRGASHPLAYTRKI